MFNINSCIGFEQADAPAGAVLHMNVEPTAENSVNGILEDNPSDIEQDRDTQSDYESVEGEAEGAPNSDHELLINIFGDPDHEAHAEAPTHSEADSDDEADPGEPSDDSDGGEVVDQDPEVDQLRAWAIIYNVKATAVDALLAILGQRVLPNVCSSTKTLMRTTKARYVIETMDDSKGNNAEFVYIGIEKQIKLHINPEFHDFKPVSDSEVVQIDYNIDGFKVFKSSCKDAWVIACKLVDKLGLYKPFTVAIFYGVGKPLDMWEYLAKFIDELQSLTINGFTVYDQHFTFSLRYVISDCPARSALKSIKGHTCFHACERCTIKGRKVSGTTVFLATEMADVVSRTNQSFREILHPSHHVDVSPFTDLDEGFDIVNRFLMDIACTLSMQAL